MKPRSDNTAITLCGIARSAAELAYAKYSNFRVGAALETEGNVYSAANIENASYGLSLCAERAVIAQAVTTGETKFTRIAVACIDAKPGDSLNSAMPCGACRQWFVEFSPDLEILIWSMRGIFEFTARELLSVPFMLEAGPESS